MPTSEDNDAVLSDAAGALRLVRAGVQARINRKVMSADDRSLLDSLNALLGCAESIVVELAGRQIGEQATAIDAILSTARDPHLRFKLILLSDVTGEWTPAGMIVGGVEKEGARR